jgi:hypothetical protein
MILFQSPSREKTAQLAANKAAVLIKTSHREWHEWCHALQLFESVDTISSPTSPGSKPADGSTVGPAYDPLRVARETAEEEASAIHHHTHDAPGHNTTRKTPSPARVGFAPDVKVHTTTVTQAGPASVGDSDGGDATDDSGLLCTSRRADSVASCASEWVNQREVGQEEVHGELLQSAGERLQSEEQFRRPRSRP